jgi:general secretion pathway protein F
MAAYRYTALDGTGKAMRGVVEASSPAAVADRVQGQGYLLLSAEPVGAASRLAGFLRADFTFRRGLSKTTLAQLTRELAIMLGAGQDVDHALRFMIDSSEDGRVKHIVTELRDRVRGGKSLAAAMAEQPKVFSRLYISLVRASEAGGTIADGLAHLAEMLERESRLASSIRSALIYPALLVTAAVCTIALLLGYVMPQFTPIFQQAGAKLPAPTQALIAAGDFVRADGLALAAVLLCIALACERVLRRAGPRMRVERLVLRLPLVGVFVRRSQAARLVRTLGTLLANGVGLVAALSIARDVLGSLFARQVVDAATIQVKSGGRLAAALAAHGFFPIQTVHLLQLGEETGTLGQMALRAAEIHDEQVRQSLQRMVALLVPAITIVMGLVVAGIVGSLLMAMLSLNDLAI